MISAALVRSYGVYGLRLSSELYLPGLRVLEDSTRQPDVSLRVGHPGPVGAAINVPWYRSPDDGPNGRPAFLIERTADGQWLLWTWCDGISFHIHSTRRQVFVRWPKGEGADSAAYYFLGPILAFLLRQLGRCLLHGSAVCAGGSAIAFLGDSGAGKSTIAATMLRSGSAALTDDVIAIGRLNGELCAWPGYPGLRLWTDSIEGLFGDAASMPRLVANSRFWPGWDKRMLFVNDSTDRFCDCAVPLRRLFVIGARTKAAASLARLSPPRQMMELDRNAYQRVMRTPDAIRSDFKVFGDLIRQAPVRMLTPTDSFRDMGPLVSLIHEDIGRD